MAHSFKINSGNKSFAVFNEPLHAGEYIYNKKVKSAYCFANGCNTNIKVGSQSNKLIFDFSNKLNAYPCLNSINKTNLYINLITKLDLENVPVIADFSGNVVPTEIDATNTTPYLTYNIDPSGNLFGNTLCGLNNYVNYMVYTAPETTTNPGYINNL
jgi:hypothetical protein